MRTLSSLLSLVAAVPAVAAAGPPESNSFQNEWASRATPAQAVPRQPAATGPQSKHRHDEQGAVILESVIDPVTGRTTTRKVHCTGHRFPAVAQPATGEPRR